VSDEGIELAFSKDAQHNLACYFDERQKMMEDIGKAAIKAFQKN